MTRLFFTFSLLAPVLTILIYRLLPYWPKSVLFDLGCRKNTPTNAAGRTQYLLSSSGQRRRIITAVDLWLMRSGRFEPDDRRKFWLSSLVVSFFVGSITLLSGRPIGIACLTSGLTWFLFSRVIALQTIRLKKAFERDLYKLYRFIDLQLSAGVRLTDTLTGLADAAPGSPIKTILLRFSAVFQLTYDLAQALEELRLLFPGTDMNLLADHLEQTLQTGQAGHSLKRMENLLFVRYFSYLQSESSALRRNLLWLALIGLLPTMVVLLFPLLMTAADALSMIFTA